jgi:hypothetical protein
MHLTSSCCSVCCQHLDHNHEDKICISRVKLYLSFYSYYCYLHCYSVIKVTFTVDCFIRHSTKWATFQYFLVLKVCAFIIIVALRVYFVLCCIPFGTTLFFFYSYFLATHPTPKLEGCPCLLSAAILHIWRLPSDKRISLVWHHTSFSHKHQSTGVRVYLQNFDCGLFFSTNYTEKLLFSLTLGLLKMKILPHSWEELEEFWMVYW